ncbi:DUF6531 domain-containing protein [Streptomyces sp. H10-C2]|uniref:DUF6531 domain-containing protein n=1 Tax=unclassified Streptomyces TaxID=2593676 RepID=UPI0024B882B1|nr:MULTISPECIES: DUF6531 domain-containing protein [unclassified Streptomyces]MDJ0340361.1 DUF6531 domain-containing protein [Streptomyces sp. PH10-H1]MDJ0368191.1 DUF6531 domain-containing protein [Streptomyces sp. H10-C2]
MGNRPADWHILDLDRDPVPGDPFEVKELARKLGDFADDVSSALRSVRGLSGDTAVQDWAGLAGDEYRKQFGDLPGELGKLEKSYRLASGALETYWPKLETAQADADRALAQGRTARQDLDAAKTTQTNTTDWVKRADDKSKEYQDNPKPGVAPPSAEEVRTATRNALDASNAQKSANSAVHDAQQRLDAAKELAAQAAHLRDTAASTAEHALHEASDAGIKNKHWWEKAVDWVADHWDDIVTVCKVIVAVLGIVVMIIGGPLAWIVLAAALVVLADTLIKYAEGKASLWDVLFAALDCIPMFKGLTTLGGLAKMAKSLPALLKSGKALENLANGVRKGASAIRETGRDIKKLVTCGDPVDMATGELVMSATDVELPGVLPLILERHHRSSYRAGRWFGKSWSSTLDQRLWADDQGVRFTSADGMVLYYPVPQSGVPVMPVEGPRWPLTWDGLPAGDISVSQPDTGRTLHFSALPGRSPAHLVLAAINDRNDNRITVGYDAEGVPAEVAHSGGYRVGIDSDAHRITALRLLSHPDRPVLLSYGYDAGGNLAEIINSSGAPLRFGYDDSSRITSWEDRNGTWYRYEYDAEGRCVFTTGTDRLLEYSYRYDDANHRTTATDSLGHTTVYQFNDHFQLVAETDPLGHTTTREWDRYDRVQAVTDPLGHTTRYAYDEHGDPVAVIRPDGSRTVAENGEHGWPVAVTQPDGHVWRMEYDSYGALTAETDPTGAQVSYRYNDIGAVTAITDAAGRTVLIETDPTGMPVATTDAEGSTTQYERDAFGRLIAQIAPDGARTTFGWTTEGRLSRRTLPDGTTERRVYDGEGNRVEHMDPAGQVTRFEYSGFDRPAARIDPDGSRLEFTYDGELRVTSVTNQLGASWRYFYDEAGRLAHEEDFTGRTQSYRHDAAGRLVEQINGAGESTVYVRDLLGKVVEQRTSEEVTTYVYDPVGNVRHVHGSHAELSYERDALGRILAETCNGATVRSTYDVLGRRTHRVTPSDAESVWEYDGRDRPVLLRTAGRTVTFAYDAAGREIERQAGAAVLTQDWDPDGRLSTQTLTARDLSSGLEPRRVQQRAYRYRPDGTVGAIDDLLHGDRVIDVDSTGRVTGVQAATWSERYAYDAAGNLTQGHWQENQPAQPTGGGPVPGGNGPGRSSGDVRYDHDAQGRVVQRRKKRLSRKPDVWQYTWDSQDRLVGVTTPDGARWAYRYDPFGRRIAKERFGPDGQTVVEQVLFAWDGFVLAEQVTRSGDDAPRCTVWNWERDRFSPVTQVDRVAAPDRAPASDRPQEWIDEQFYSIVTDLVGTPAELVDEEGELAWRARTTAWGAGLSEPGPDRAYCPLRFPGQYHDPETALNYNYYRHYDPETGQYASLDPLGLAPGPNPRTYVANPFTAVDPLGLAPDCEAAARQAARARADLEQGRPGASKNTRPTSSAGLSVPGHPKTFDGASIKGGGDHDLHPDIQAAYDDVPQAIKDEMKGQHGRCGEPEALSNAVRAGVNPRGGVMAAVNVRAPGNPMHGVPKPPCPSCKHVLDNLGITAVT